MEVASGDYGSDLTKVLSSAMQKQYNDMFNDDIVAVADGKICFGVLIIY